MNRPKVEELAVEVYVKKRITYPTGFVCNYTLKDGQVNGYSFSKGIPYDLLLPDHTQETLDKVLKSSDNFKEETPFSIFDLKDVSESFLINVDTTLLYSAREGLLLNYLGEFLPTYKYLYNVYLRSVKGGGEVAEIFKNFVESFDGITVIAPLEMGLIPYYNQNENGDGYCIVSGVVILSQELNEKFINTEKVYFKDMSFRDYLMDKFLEKYPEYILND